MAPNRSSQDRKVRAEQSKRFLEAARELGLDPNSDVDEVMRRLAGQKPEKRPSSKRQPKDHKTD